MRHDDDGVALLELLDEILYTAGGDRIKRRGGLIHEDDLRLDRDRAGNAEALLLPTGEGERILPQAILHLVPQGCPAHAPLYDLIELAFVLNAVSPRAECHVVVDRLREGVGLLEHHADLPPQPHRFDIGVVDVLTVQQHLAGLGGRPDEIVHPV